METIVLILKSHIVLDERAHDLEVHAAPARMSEFEVHLAGQLVLASFGRGYDLLHVRGRQLQRR